MLVEVGFAGGLIGFLFLIIGFPIAIVYLPIWLREKQQQKQKVMKLIAKLIQKNGGLVSEMDLYLAAGNDCVDIDIPLFSSLLKAQAAYFHADTLVSEEGVIYYHFPLEKTTLLLN
ncbi:MAG: hypothetical protein N5P05_001134 [Chroococcopsis gigantea SAG 12.99]|jgi:hypothetical protein|nr:hypothetical protein [Chlorogloea purpurea SAG 13.99]MDV2999528.1 hypothetical protein [Chroococcopsis gigantea SAG 12.99]